MRPLPRRPHAPFAELVRIESDPAYRDRYFPGLSRAIAQRGHWRSGEAEALVRRLRAPAGITDAVTHALADQLEKGSDAGPRHHGLGLPAAGVDRCRRGGAGAGSAGVIPDGPR